MTPLSLHITHDTLPMTHHSWHITLFQDSLDDGSGKCYSHFCFGTADTSLMTMTHNSWHIIHDTSILCIVNREFLSLLLILLHLFYFDDYHVCIHTYFSYSLKFCHFFSSLNYNFFFQIRDAVVVRKGWGSSSAANSHRQLSRNPNFHRNLVFFFYCRYAMLW